MACVKNWSESAQYNTKSDLSKFLEKSYWNLPGAIIRATAKCHYRTENQEFKNFIYWLGWFKIACTSWVISKWSISVGLVQNSIYRLGLYKIVCIGWVASK